MYFVLIFNTHTHTHTHTHVHFIYSNLCVTQTLTLNIPARVEERKRNTPKCIFNSTKEFSSMGNSQRKIEKAGRGI